MNSGFQLFNILKVAQKAKILEKCNKQDIPMEKLGIAINRKANTV